jgi:cell division protease FtsH
MAEAADDFRALFGEFVRRSLEVDPREEPAFRILIREHLGIDPQEAPVVALQVPTWDHANLQLALEALLEQPGRSSEMQGIAGGQKRYMSLSLSDLLNERHFRPGPPEYESVDIGPGETHRCLLFGLVLLKDEAAPAVLLVRVAEQHGPGGGGMQVEALSPDPDHASKLLDELRELMKQRNVFRGQMISLESTMWGQTRVVFHERPETRRDEVVLPEIVLADIERQTIGITRQADALRAAQRHLKRGVLLYGPPGTGKTHTVSWLAAELRDATVIVLSGGSLGAAGPVSRLARELAPSLVVLEDVDLVAEERTMMHGGGPILFELLNELDGMADDADVLVLLTTNRADLLEPALAARPGRVDLAVEIPLPDGEARRKLLDLYARGLDLQLADPGAVVTRTAGVAASFFRELLRQAALEAADDSGGTVRDEHVGRALDRLLERASAMTKILLGAERRDAPGSMPLPSPHGWMAAPGVVTARMIDAE